MNRFFPITLFFVLIMPAHAQEQQVFTIAGTVLDDDSLPVRGAMVVLHPTARKDTTDAAGMFRFERISAGEYTVTASQQYLGLKDARLKITVQGRSYETDEVVVVARTPGRETPAPDTSAMVSVAERNEFGDRAETVAEVIAAAPGANIRTMGGLGDYTEVSLRGSNGQQVQVYLDGMRLNEAVGGAVNLSTIPLAQAQSVEVWRSGAPARFGGGAVGGAVNIRTRDFLAENGTASFGYGSLNTLHASALRQAAFGSSRLLFSAGYSSSDNDFRFKNDNGTVFNTEDDSWNRRRNDGFRSLNLLGKYRAALGESMLLEISEHLVSNDKELPGRDIVQTSDASIATLRNLLQARLAASPFLHGFLEAEPQVYHTYTREHYRDLSGSVGWGAQDNLYRSNALRFALPVTAKTGKLATITLTPGADREWYRPEHRRQKTIPLSGDREGYSVALDSALRLFRERLILTSGLSRERSFSSFEGQPSQQNRATPKPRRILLTNAGVGAKLALGNHLSLLANYSDAIRVPSFYELFGDRGTTFSNPNLKPERTFRRDAGIRGEGAAGAFAFSLEGAYFHSLNRNLIQWYTNDAGFLFPDNVGASYIRGTELIWSLRFGKRFSCRGNWTVQNSKVTAEKNSIYRGKRLPNRPENYGSVQAEYPFRRVIPFWSMSRKGAYYLDRANQAHKRYPGRILHDLGVTFPLPDRNLRLTVEARNLTDRHTFDTQGMPLPGRSLACTMTWEK
ncbi:MAG: TonB-dependent receptor [Candidatus Latescibacterota bacterium]